MLREDWEKENDKCTGCGAPATIICRCEVIKFRSNDENNSDYGDD